MSESEPILCKNKNGNERFQSMTDISMNILDGEDSNLKCDRSGAREEELFTIEVDR